MMTARGHTAALPNLVCVRNASGRIEHYVTVFGGIRYCVSRSRHDDWEIEAFRGDAVVASRVVGRLSDACYMIGRGGVVASVATPSAEVVR